MTDTSQSQQCCLGGAPQIRLGPTWALVPFGVLSDPLPSLTTTARHVWLTRCPEMFGDLHLGDTSRPNAQPQFQRAGWWVDCFCWLEECSVSFAKSCEIKLTEWCWYTHLSNSNCFYRQEPRQRIFARYPTQVKHGPTRAHLKRK